MHSIDFVVAFPAHYLFIHFPYAVPKASLCAENKSQKLYALVGLPELAILTLADSEEGLLAVIFFYKLELAVFMWHSYIDFYILSWFCSKYISQFP